MDIKINVESMETLNERFRMLREFNTQEINCDTVLPPRPLVDEDNFDDDHIEMINKELLEEELDQIHQNLEMYHICCSYMKYLNS